MVNLQKTIEQVKALHKKLKNEETYKNSIFLQILKNDKVDTAKLKEFGTKNNQTKYVLDVFKYAEELEDRHILKYEERTATFLFTSKESKELLYSEVLKNIQKIEPLQNDENTSDEKEITLKNDYIKNALRNAYDSVSLTSRDEKTKFMQSMIYFNNFSFNNIINLHAQQLEKGDSFNEDVRYYQTFNHYKNDGTRVNKGSKALKLFIPTRLPLYEQDSNGRFIENNGNRVPLLDSNGKQRFATSFTQTNIFEHSQTNYGIEYKNSDRTLITKLLTHKMGHTPDPYVYINNETDYLFSVINEELAVVSSDDTANYLASFIVMNRLGFKLDLSTIEEDYASLSKEDFLTLTREVNSLSKSFERKYNLDEILKEATQEIATSKENVVNEYAQTSRDKKIKNASVINQEIKERVLSVKDSLGEILKNNVVYDTFNNDTIGVSIFGVTDEFKPIAEYIEEIKSTEAYQKAFKNNNDSELIEIVNELKEEIKQKDVFIQSSDKEVANVTDAQKNANAEVYSNDSLYGEYDSASELKQDLQRGKEQVKAVSKGAKLQAIKPFINDVQLSIISRSSEHNDTIDSIYDTVISMPKTYATDGLDDSEKMVKMHYFSGDSDWYIVEKDIEEEQLQAYGYVVLNGDLQNAESDYINIEELKKLNVEMDFYWEERSLRQLKNELFADDEVVNDFKDLTIEKAFVNKYFRGLNENEITLLTEYLSDDSQELPDIDSPLAYRTGLINANVMADNETYMMGFKNLKSNFIREVGTIIENVKYVNRVKGLYATLDTVRDYYGVEWRQELISMWNSGMYDNWIGSDQVSDLQFLRNQTQNLYRLHLSSDLTAQEYLSLAYPFMDDEDKEENRDVLDSTISNRTHRLAIELGFESPEEWLKYAEYKTDTNGVNNIELKVFGVADEFKPLEQYISELKNTATYKLLSESKSESVDMVDVWIDRLDNKLIELYGVEAIQKARDSGDYDFYSFMQSGGEAIAIKNHNTLASKDFSVHDTVDDSLAQKLYETVINLKDDEKLEEAEITFRNSDEAESFARDYSRKTLRGHTILANTVKVYGLQSEDKVWIDNYVANLNSTKLEDMQDLDELVAIFSTNSNAFTDTTVLMDVKSVREYINYLSGKYPRFLTTSAMSLKNTSLYSNYMMMDAEDNIKYLHVTHDGNQEWETLDINTAKERLERAYFPQFVREWGLDKQEQDETLKRLKESRLTPVTYYNSTDKAKTSEHVMITANGRHFIAMGFADNLDSREEAQKLLESNEFAKLQERYTNTKFEIQTIHGHDIEWQASDKVGIFEKEAGGDGHGDLRWTMFGTNALELATSLCISKEVENLAYLSEPNNKANHKQTEIIKKALAVSDTEKYEIINSNEFKQYFNKYGFENIDELIKKNDYDEINERLAIYLKYRDNPKTQSVVIETQKIGAKTKFRQNIEALEVIEKIESGAEVSDLSKQDIVLLSKYTGWGGIPQAFRKFNGEITKGWEKEVQELETLLPQKKLEELRSTILTSFYTPTQIADSMVVALENMGYRGYGNIIEPSVGIGTMLSRFSNTLKQGSKIDAVEIDKTTAKITKALFPNVNVMTKAFQDAELRDNYYNIVIGNPPFGDMKIPDSNKNLNNLSLHNYFMAKSADKLAVGGIMAMVVSSYFMDSSDQRAREHIAGTCNLVGAIRLPNNAFTDTQVTTDILFFQKRTQEMQSNADAWLQIGELNETPINTYFERNQENLLGKWGRYGTMYGGGQPALVSEQGQDTLTLLNERIAQLPKNIYKHEVSAFKPFNEAEEELIEYKYHDSAKALTDAKLYTYKIIKNEIFMKISESIDDNKMVFKKVTTRTNSNGDKIELKEKEIERIKGMVEVIEKAEMLRDAQLYEVFTDEQVEHRREQLNKSYDSFVKEYGYLSNESNKRLFRYDNRYAFALSLEKDYTKAVSKKEADEKQISQVKESAKKADIFSKRTQTPFRVPTHADNSLDAMTISLTEHGKINVRYMCELTGFTSEKIIDDLILVDAVYNDPSVGLVTKEEYLSGNVKKKLKEAYEKRNIEALTKVIPKDLEAHEITVSCGASWLPEKHMKDFASFITGDSRAEAIYVPALAQWKINSYNTTLDANINYATERKSVSQILEASANNAQIKIYDTQLDGSKKFNEVQSQLANDKVEKVRDAFKKWVYQDDARRNDLVTIYNDKFNTHVERKYDGSLLQFRGMSEGITLRPHQKNFVRKFIEGKGVNLADHSVGTGKTYTAQACIMESKRIGRANKAIVVVPNYLTEQWGAEWLQLYPNANVLVATKDDFTKKERPIFLNRIATGDWDAIIIGHSQLVKIGVSKEFEEKFIYDQIDAFEESIRILESRDGKSFTTKQIENKIQKLELKLKALLNKPADTTLDDLGIDLITVDEVHKFKNLAYSTSLVSVGSLGNPNGSQRAEDLFLKTRSLLNRTHDRNLLVLTGTPVSNSIVEMYTMQRYMQYDDLRELGLLHFDSWAKQYAEVVTEFELKPNGNYEPKARLSKFDNVPDLIKQYKMFADVVTKDDVVADAKRNGMDLKIPKVRGGKPTNVVVERSDLQARLIGIENEDGTFNEGSLIDRAIKLHGKKPEKGKDNILVIINDSKQIALDPRIKNADYPDNPNSKVNVMLQHAMELYKKYNEDKGAQLIFCDMSIPKGNRNAEKERLEELFRIAQDETLNEDKRLKAEEELEKMSVSEIDAILSDNTFSVYDDIKEKLIANGIPEREIAFIHDAKTDDQRKSLFEKVRRGDIRFLLGSTSKMGEGMNVQERLVGLYHLDAPWRPSDIEQREGRIIRQGNKLYDKYPDFDVAVERFATKGTLDSTMWETLERKQISIEQIKNGACGRSVEDISGESATMADMKASASGNPYILEEVKLKREIKKLETLQANHDSVQFRARDKIRGHKSVLESAESDLVKLDVDTASANEYLKVFEKVNEENEKIENENKRIKEQNKEVQKANKIAEKMGKQELIKPLLEEIEPIKANIASINGFEVKKDVLSKKIESIVEDLQRGKGSQKEQIKFGDFDISFEIDRNLGNLFDSKLCVNIDANSSYGFEMIIRDISSDGIITRIQNKIKRVHLEKEDKVFSLERIEKELPELEKALKEFDRDDELALLRKRYTLVTNSLKYKNDAYAQEAVKTYTVEKIESLEDTPKVFKISMKSNEGNSVLTRNVMTDNESLAKSLYLSVLAQDKSKEVKDIFDNIKDKDLMEITNVIKSVNDNTLKSLGDALYHEDVKIDISDPFYVLDDLIKRDDGVVNDTQKSVNDIETNMSKRYKS